MFRINLMMTLTAIISDDQSSKSDDALFFKH